MRDGVFGASDEELSELSEHEIVAVPKKLFDAPPGAGASKTAPSRVARENGGAGRGRKGGSGGGESKAEEEVTDPSSGSESDRAPPVRGRGRKVVGSFASNPTATQQEKKATKPSKHNKASVKRRAVAEESEIDEDGHSGSESDRAPPVKGKGGRGRRVVSSFISGGQVEAAPEKADATALSRGKLPKKKAIAKELEYEDDDERPPSSPPQSAATIKTQTRPAERKSVPQPPKAKEAKQRKKEVVEEPMEEEEGGDSPAPRRSTRASAAAASKKIANVVAAGNSSQESGIEEGAKEKSSPLPPPPVLPKVVAKPRAAITKTKGRCFCSCCMVRRLKWAHISR